MCVNSSVLNLPPVTCSSHESVHTSFLFRWHCLPSHPSHPPVFESTSSMILDSKNVPRFKRTHSVSTACPHFMSRQHVELVNFVFVALHWSNSIKNVLTPQLYLPSKWDHRLWKRCVDKTVKDGYLFLFVICINLCHNSILLLLSFLIPYLIHLSQTIDLFLSWDSEVYMLHSQLLEQKAGDEKERDIYQQRIQWTWGERQGLPNRWENDGGRRCVA